VTLPPDLPVVDHHCHLAPSGEGVAAARRFARAGGTHLFLATQNYAPGPPTRLEGYREQFATTIALAGRVRAEAGVVAFPVLAPHPVDLVRQREALGLAAAVDLHRAALEAAGAEVRAGRAVALGEIGRPHFPVEPDVADAAEALFDHALGVARDVGCPAVVHSEDLDAAGYRALADRGHRAGLPPDRLVKHYARTVVAPAERAGVVPSILARRDLVRESLAHAGPWFWETDFLDDPARPGAVLDLATVARRAAAIAETEAGRRALRVPFVESIERVYGLTLTVDRGAGP